jgi:hypothetical protein
MLFGMLPERSEGDGGVMTQEHSSEIWTMATRYNRMELSISVLRTFKIEA